MRRAGGLKPSYYNHFAATDDVAVVVAFNKYCGSVALVSAGTARALRAGELHRLEPDELRMLEQSGFVVDEAVDEIELAHARYLRRKRENTLLTVTVELTQACNLACTYCYQNSYRGKGVISSLTIEKIERYVRAVVVSGWRPITHLDLRFIGGEPLLQKRTIHAAIARMIGVCDELELEFSCHVDTNGLLLDERVVKDFDFISVSLTNRADHDTVRVRHNGRGSYDTILARLRRHRDHFNAYETTLSIRYNANAANAEYVFDTYRLVREIGVRDVRFDLQRTINYDYNERVPPLTREAFKRLYLDLVKIKFAHGEVLEGFPTPTFAPCSAYTPLNVKVTADGRLALCDDMHQPAGSLDELVADLRHLARTFESVATHDPFLDPQCRVCTDVGICGGKLYCKTKPNVPDNNPRDFLQFEMDEYLRFFAKAVEIDEERALAALEGLGRRGRGFDGPERTSFGPAGAA